jgi:hypothetical protein
MALLAKDIQIKWHLFINSLKSSVKAVLLHKHVSKQRSPTIHMKITFNMHLLVKHIRSNTIGMSELPTVLVNM